MNQAARARRSYVRSMRGWWLRDPAFMQYMLRETTAVGVLAYTIVMTFGVLRLAQGETAWNSWLAALRSPWAVMLHGLLLAAMVIHARSWFAIMPKTMPMLFVGGRRVSAATITHTGWAATVSTTIAVLALAFWWQP